MLLQLEVVTGQLLGVKERWQLPGGRAGDRCLDC